MQLLSSIVSLMVGIIGISVVVRNRQLSRAAIRLHIGQTALEPDQPKVVRRLPKRVIVFGLSEINRDYFLLPVPIVVENCSLLPITNVRLQIEYPSECLLDDSEVRNNTGARVSFGSITAHGRQATRFATLAHVTYDFELIRAAEKLQIHEIIRLPRSHVPGVTDSHHETALQQHWSGADAFCSAFHLELSLFGANCPPVALLALVVGLLADSEAALTSRADELMLRLWNGHSRPEAKVFARNHSVELAELKLLTKDSFVASKPVQVDPTILRSARTAVLKFVVPPWGITGRSGEA